MGLSDILGSVSYLLVIHLWGLSLTVLEIFGHIVLKIRHFGFFGAPAKTGRFRSQRLTDKNLPSHSASDSVKFF